MKTKPVNMNIELTTRCPLNCPQCYCDLNTGKDIEPQVAKYWISEAAKNGVESIYLSGGETLCYPYLFEVLAEACKVCANVNMAISGYGFTQDVFEKIKAVGINGLSVSLNGSTNEINSLTRDGYSLAIKALSLLHDNDYPHTILNWVMHSNNCDDFPNVVAIAEQYKVSQIIVFGFKPDKHHELNTQPTYTQMKQVANFIKNYRGTVKINVESCYSPLLAIASETPIFGNLNVGVNKGCLAGISRFSISVDGKLSPCRHLDLYEDHASLEEYWSNSRILDEIRKMHESKELPCAGCHYEKYCRPCLAVEHKINGSFYAGNRLCPVAAEKVEL